MMTKAKEFTIKTTLRGLGLTFKTTWGLFSLDKIDQGTRLLIENIETKPRETMVDLGCGYGAVGVVMGKLNPTGKTIFVDRDIVAINYSQINCKANGINNAEFILCNGLEAVETGRVDCIAANLPTHVSNEMLGWMIESAKEVLRPKGKLAVVTVSKLRPFIKRSFEEIFEIGRAHV